MKTSLVCLALILLLTQPVSAEIAPIIWSESLQNTPKPTTELVNLDNYMILKSDHSLSINLNDRSPIKAIDLRLDNNQTIHLNKQDFLFNIQLSDKITKIIDIPFGEHKFN
ncbi:hypothetical protein [Sporomusa malonica]|uniref:Uncharacterized protein n=1 Tax=Sporomusa malonica TaxID=112901 RepID=A0A1W2EHY9_9FIRM|nr:hypothetical protein [Sporomusa malonica]SMD09313.1 hypothetical protein SAMN04488500_12468 [Sporomusa malonica]